MGHFYSLLLPANVVNWILPLNVLHASHYPFSCAFKCPNCLSKPSQVESPQFSHRADSDALDIQRPRPCDSQRHDWEERDQTRSCNLSLPQVFLSHSGKQENFVRHLYKEMKSENISCFFDEESLRMAEEFPPHIFEAAMKCKVAVVVLSEEFISTEWPMLELSAFIKAQTTTNKSIQILPLFFAMSPDTLAQKLQKEDLLKRWQKLQQKRSINLDEWIKALEKLRRINGIKYIESEGEVAYINKIVAHIRDMLPPCVIYDESDVQGKERLCQEVAKLFDETPCLENGARIAGLYGVGGIGKTTTAKFLCNFYSEHFDGRVLQVEFGREKANETLKRALRILCRASQSLVSSVITMDEGWYHFNELMYGKSVFLTLDNISAEYTQEVRMYLKAVCHGNRCMILLTARSLFILEQFIHEGEISCMPVPSLQEDEATAVLLNRTPFKFSNLTTGQKIFARKCVRKCCFSRQYHPLALKIFGKFLYVKFQYSRWIDVPNISGRDQMQKIFDKFKWSLASLRLQHRKIFMLLSVYLPYSYMTLEESFSWLAVVCSEEVGDIESAIIELEEKGFIESTKKSWNKLYIHDLLLAFAESEADGTEKWISLKGKDEIPSSLQESASNDRPKFSAMRFENCHFEIPGIVNNKLFTDILVLHLENMRTLKIVDLSSMKMVRSVTIIDCSGLEEIHGLKSLSSLAYFLIKYCPTDVRFCPGIQCLRALRHLKVHANLQETTIRSLQGPRSLFPPFQDTSNLGTLWLDHFDKGFGPLHLAGCSKLQTIELSNCDITLLDLTGSSKLRTIYISECRDLRVLPSLSGLPNLKSLILQGGGLRELPSLSGLSNLKILELGILDGLRELPSLSGLSNLKILELWNLDGLRELPSLSGLPNLKSLILQDMGGLRELPSLSGLSNLKILELGNLDGLRELPSLSGLSNLKILKLSNLDGLRELPSLSGLPNLRCLSLEGMGDLRELPNLNGLPNMSSLTLEGMGGLMELPSLSGLPNLRSLRLKGMGDLRELPSLNGLPNLSYLTLEGMGGLMELPSLSGLPNLSSLRLEGMGGLRELSSLSGLPNLSSLIWKGMGSLRELPSLSGLLNLNSLVVAGMSNLREPPSLSGLSNLKSLVYVGMSNLREPPSLSGLPNLNSLVLGDMGSLLEPPSVSGLPNLSSLVLGDIYSLRELPSLNGLLNLSSLVLDSLREFPSLNGLPNLKSLVLWNMDSLTQRAYMMHPTSRIDRILPNGVIKTQPMNKMEPKFIEGYLSCFGMLDDDA